LTAPTRMRQLPEIWLLGSLLLIASLLLIFIFIAQDVFEGETAAFDRGAILAFRSAANISDPVGPPWVEEAVRDITALGSITVVVILSGAVIFYLLLLRKRGSAVLMLISVAGGTVLNDLLKYFFDRPRPDLVLHGAQVFTSSFPSGHAAVSAVVYLTLGALLARDAPSIALKIYVLAVAIVLVFLIGVSRVFLGLHYPTDVLAGWSIGSAWALICWLAAGRLQHRHAAETRR
jgi:undecaprenyl-diphosphatase